MYHLRRIATVALFLGFLVFITWLGPRVLNPTPPTPEERRRDRAWVDSSPYWADRQACRWLSLCGLHHVRSDPPNGTEPGDGGELRMLELRGLEGRRGSIEREQIQSWEVAGRGGGIRRRGDGKMPKGIPDFVLAHAPLVHLYSGENFWPADIAEHVRHMTPFSNGSALNHSLPLSLSKLHLLDEEKAVVYLTSDEDVETRPDWLHNRVGTPSPFGDDGEDVEQHPVEDDDLPLSDGTTWFNVDKDHPLRRISDPRKTHEKWQGPRRRIPRDENAIYDDGERPQHKPDSSGYSKGPAVLVMVDKGSGILDAFWFFFYSYNLGQTVLGVRYGNHIGDWEHCMVRFESGVPRAMFLSEHAGGQAYAWEALEKYRPKGNTEGEPGPERPVIYSAVGSHAMYALPGKHPYVLPFKMLKDETDKGPLWDPAKNQYAYFYDYLLDEEEDRKTGQEPSSLRPAATNPDAPTSWFHFAGPWGDELYKLADSRQYRLFGQYHYITGPQGPKFKNLEREKVCEKIRCRILYTLDAGKRGTWYS